MQILPQSTVNIKYAGEAHVSAIIASMNTRQITDYLDFTLGAEAPRPNWTLPGGWNSYVAELLSWATGTAITPEQALKVAKIGGQNVWMAVEEELHNLGVHPEWWPMPLTVVEIQAEERAYVPLPAPKPKPPPAVPTNVRQY